MIIRAQTLLTMAAVLTSAACTVNQTVPPSLTGPSDYATSLVVTATPDIVVLNGQQSLVTVQARNAAGEPIPNLHVYLDVFVGGISSACGRLSVSDVVTGADGRASVVFTAPTLPLPQPECSNFGGSVTIAAVPVGSNFQTSNLFTASIGLILPSVSVTPQVFTVNFAVSPNPARVFQDVTFSDAGSVSPGNTITGYRWTFSDGHVELGQSITHDFGAPGQYVATLTISDSAGQEGSKSALVTITP